MEWFYEHNGHQIGPVPRSEIMRQIVARRIGPQTYVWTASFGDQWRRASEAGLIASPAAETARGAEETSAFAPPVLPIRYVTSLWAWVLLLAPNLTSYLIFAILGYRHVPLADQSLSLLPAAFSQLCIFFLAYFMDRQALSQAGLSAPGFWWWLFLPGYFWKRRRILGHGTALLVVSLVLMALRLGIVYEFPQLRHGVYGIEHFSQGADQGGARTQDDSSDEEAEI